MKNFYHFCITVDSFTINFHFIKCLLYSISLLLYMLKKTLYKTCTILELLVDIIKVQDFYTCIHTIANVTEFFLRTLQTWSIVNPVASNQLMWYSRTRITVGYNRIQHYSKSKNNSTGVVRQNTPTNSREYTKVLHFMQDSKRLCNWTYLESHKVPVNWYIVRQSCKISCFQLPFIKDLFHAAYN